MVSLSLILDQKSLTKKISFIWNEWTNQKDFLNFTSKESFAFKLFLWVLRSVLI